MTVHELGALSAEQANQSFNLVTATVGPGRGISGREQVIFRESRYWQGAIDFRQFFFGDRLKARALASRLRGRFGSLRITIDNRGTPIKSGTDAAFWLALGISQSDIDRGFSGYSDGTIFDDGTGFDLPSTASPTAYEAAPAGSTIVRLIGGEATGLLPGAYFSVNDFLHICEENTSGVVVFSPPLRQAVASGAAANIASPTIRVKLADDAGFSLKENYAHHTDPLTLTVVEDFQR